MCRSHREGKLQSSSELVVFCYLHPLIILCNSQPIPTPGSLSTSWSQRQLISQLVLISFNPTQSITSIIHDATYTYRTIQIGGLIQKYIFLK